VSHTIYLVVRRPWESDEFPCHEERVPVRGFADRAAAEAHCRELEMDFRRRHDVFPLFYQTWSTEEWDRFQAAAVRLGVPAEDGSTSAEDWWDQNKDSLTAEQRLALWDAGPDCFAYEVMKSKLHD
jgi:hypothetical protein